MPGRTLVEIFDGCVARPRPDLLLYRGKYRWQRMSTGEFARRVRALSCALPGLRVGPGDRVILLSENRPEWQIVDFAVQNAGAVTVPIYPTLPASQVRPLLADCGAKAAFVSNRAQLEKLREASEAAHPLPIVVFDPPGAGEGADLGGLPLEMAIRRGEEEDRADPRGFDRRRQTVGPESLATIIYTSGTTGSPKGVMLTHGNFASNIEGCLMSLPLGAGDVVLSFLPLSHVLQRMFEYTSFSVTACIAYAQSMETVPRDMAEVSPTIVPAVPRFFEKIHARIMGTVASSSRPRQAAFRWAMRQGRKRLETTLAGRPVPLSLRVKSALGDRVVGRRVRRGVGGRLRFFISGGAPLSRELAEFFPAAGILVLEGYGLTETSPVIAVNSPDRFRPGTVGSVLPGLDVRIADDGEILVRGPSVMKGYWNRPLDTEQVLRDGWFHTGDIGFLDPEGFLTITDRKKDLIVTSAGKNVAPQPIENALKNSTFIANAVCVGDRRNYVAALIVPEIETLRGWAIERGLTAVGDSLADLLARPEVKDLYRREIDSVTVHLARFEKIKRFALLERDFSLEEGELTPTLKVRRRIVCEKFTAVITSLYPADGGSPEGVQAERRWEDGTGGGPR